MRNQDINQTTQQYRDDERARNANDDEPELSPCELAEATLTHCEWKCSVTSGLPNFSYWQRRHRLAIMDVSEFRPLTAWENDCLSPSLPAAPLPKAQVANERRTGLFRGDAPAERPALFS